MTGGAAGGRTPLDGRTFDVIVLGAGIAGLSAASHLQEAGLDVALVEKRTAIGGSSAMSGGFFAFSGTDEQAAAGVEDSRELFRADLVSVGQGYGDERLLDTYLDAQEHVYRWMRGRGAVFRALEQSSGQSTQRSHLTSIRELLGTLADHFVEAGGTLLLEHAGSRLLRTEARVSGVVLAGPHAEVTLHARHGIVLATGGFSRGVGLLRTFAPEQLAAIPYGGPGNTGDGLRMAWRLGAGLADMSFISATFGSHPETGEESHELLTSFYMGAIIVNREGRRYTDESQSYKTLGAATLEQPDGLGFQVFDAAVRAQSHDGVPLADIAALERIGHVHRADSLAELAAVAGIDADALQATVDRYNTAVRTGGPDELGRTHLVNGVGELRPIERAPFYAYPSKALMTSTYCGVTITPRAEVLDVDGAVIDGLFAIGEVTGGFHGAAYMTGTSLGKGAVFGWIAARRIVELAG